MTQEIDILLLRYNKNEATAAEKARCEAWLAESDENMQYYKQMCFIMQHTGSSSTPWEVDVDAAWLKMQQKLGFEQTPPQETKDTKLRKLDSRKWMMISIAASVVLLLASGVWLLTGSGAKTDNQIRVQFASVNTTLSKQLDDGSSVALAKNSKLRYAVGFGTDNRRVELEGEAFFEVKHNDALPFTVVTQGITITDVGTAFNVESRDTDSMIVVAVTDGVVDISLPTGETKRVVKGETARYNKLQKVMTLDSVVSVNATAHKTRRFVFENTKMCEVAAQLNSAYEQEIAIESDELREKQISVMFNNESLDVIVAILCETLPCKSHKTETGFVLEK